MFDQTFVNGTQQARKHETVLLSLVLQASVICLLILLPLVYTQALPNAQLRNLLVAPAPPAAVPAPPARHVQSRIATHAFIAPRLFAPARIPAHINQMDDAPSAPEIAPGANSAPAGPILDSLVASVAVAPAPPPAAQPKPPGLVRIGGKVAAANVIYSVRPAYPSLAKAARVQGTVEFTAVISKEGKIENLTLLRGHPLLVSAAREAVSQWKYRPTLLNGQPVEVITDIIVNFTLSP